MPHGTVEEFLQFAVLNKRIQFIEITSHHWHRPPGRDEAGNLIPGVGSINKTSRVRGTRQEPFLCPYTRVKHLLRQNALLGVDYESMVNAQRSREAAQAMADLMADLPSYVKVSAEVEPFIASNLWGGHGQVDDQFPRFAVRHDRYGTRYIKFWPACNEKGHPIPNESKYFDQDGNELDFKRDLAEFWKKPSKNKSQGTEKEIHWNTVKFHNIVQIKANKMTWTFDGPTDPFPVLEEAAA